MKNLFEKETLSEIEARISSLTPSSARQWGKMNVGQMLAHCRVSLQAATGEKDFPRLLIGKIFGRFARPQIMQEKPFPHNSPTNPGFIITGETEFETERNKLLETINRFHEGGEIKCTSKPHSFFGNLTPLEWARLMYKHIDHHLRQFGV